MGAHGDSISSALSELTPAEEMDNALDQMLTGTLQAGGASPEEVTCLGDKLANDPDPPPLYGRYGPESPEVLALSACGTPERIAEILREAYDAPIRDRLTAAGATDAEARCLVAEIESIDLWFPETGNEDASLTGDVFAEDGAACGTPARLREIAMSLHG